MLENERWLTASLPDGRVLEIVVGGPEDGVLLLAQGGTPGAAGLFRPALDEAAERGIRTAAYSRPGYAGSTVAPGRTVSDATADVEAVLDVIGVDTFLTVGRSGGGPHALACAARLPGRCQAAVSLSGFAPYQAEGLDWMAGMGPENIEELGLALEGEAALTPWLEKEAKGMAGVHASEVADSFGELLPEIDKAALTGEYAEFLAAQLHRSVSTGVAGWRDDDLAFIRPWGFDLAAIEIPVSVWQGGQDLMVPLAHGEWLAEHIPSCRKHVYLDEGHLSLGVSGYGRVLDDLLEMAG